MGVRVIAPMNPVLQMHSEETLTVEFTGQDGHAEVAGHSSVNGITSVQSESDAAAPEPSTHDTVRFRVLVDTPQKVGHAGNSSYNHLYVGGVCPDGLTDVAHPLK